MNEFAHISPTYLEFPELSKRDSFGDEKKLCILKFPDDFVRSKALRSEATSCTDQ